VDQRQQASQRDVSGLVVTRVGSMAPTSDPALPWVVETTKTVGDQLFERPVILRHRQVRIIRARTAPRRTAAETDARPPRYTVSPCTGGTTAAGSSGNKLIFHGFGRSPTCATGCPTATWRSCWPNGASRSIT
jgi:hypothetical protein